MVRAHKIQVAVYFNPGTMIEAPETGQVVHLTPINLAAASSAPAGRGPRRGHARHRYTAATQLRGPGTDPPERAGRRTRKYNFLIRIYDLAIATHGATANGGVTVDGV